MARTKRRDLSRPPPPAPPPPPLHDSSSSSEDEDDKVDLEAAAATAAPPNPTADDSDSDADDSDSDADVQAFQVRPALRSPTNRQSDQAAAASSDPDNLEPPAPAPKDDAEKKKKKRRAPTIKARASNSTGVEVVVGLAAAAVTTTAPQNPNHHSTDVHHDAVGGGEPGSEPDDDPAKPASKKRPAPTGKATKTKKANGKKAVKRPRVVEPEQTVPGPLQSSGKPGKRVWTADDEIKILEAIVAHVKRHGVQPKTGDLLATVGDTLQRKNCNYTEIYEKVRSLNKRYEKVAEKGELSVKGDELRMYKLSLAIWGKKNAGDVASDSTSQDNGVPSESNKDQVHGDGDGDGDADADGNGNGDGDGDADGNGDGDADADGNGDGSGDADGDGDGDGDADGNGDGSGDADGNGDGDGDADGNGDGEGITPKEAVPITQNDGIKTRTKKGGTQKEEIGTDASVQGRRREFVELQSLYPCLASYVERIAAQHPCRVTLTRAFELISDKKACALESKIKKQKIAEVKMEIGAADIRKEVANVFL